jgi:hypothetical protein
MTEPKTSEEWHVRFECTNCNITPDEIRDIQRNALEAAAKAVCWNCRQGYAVNQLMSTVWRHQIGALSVPCEATEIWDLIPNDPPPAQADKDEPEEGEDDGKTD